MNRRTGFVLIIFLVFGLQLAFAQNDLPETPAVFYQWDYTPALIHEPVIFLPVATLASAASSDADSVDIPQNIRNNRFYLESIRLTKMAQSSFDEGDYDASNEYAIEAIRYAELSDGFVEQQLKIKETNDAIAVARQRLEWADSSGVGKQYPAEYEEAQGFFQASLSARNAEEWDNAIEAANNVINVLAYVTAPGSGGELPAQYVVRSWTSARDCLWNIAGRSWAYGDPFKWKILYEANKHKLPEIDNPDLIEPGMVIDIPSVNNEVRKGMWQADKTY